MDFLHYPWIIVNKMILLIPERRFKSIAIETNHVAPGHKPCLTPGEEWEPVYYRLLCFSEENKTENLACHSSQGAFTGKYIWTEHSRFMCNEIITQILGSVGIQVEAS